jgi:chromosome segregation ATPase
LDEIQKEGYSSFGELRKAREAASNIQKESLRGELATLHKEVERLQQEIDQRETKVRSKAEIEKQVEELKKQLPDATQSVDQKVLEELEKQQALLKKLEEQISKRNRRRRSIDGASESYASVKTGTTQELAKIEAQLIGLLPVRMTPPSA